MIVVFRDNNKEYEDYDNDLYAIFSGDEAFDIVRTKLEQERAKGIDSNSGCTFYFYHAGFGISEGYTLVGRMEVPSRKIEVERFNVPAALKLPD